MTVRTRIAPSPTGEDLHIGNLYTALFNWAYARQNNGQFIVRIEDTDQSRKVKDSEFKILKTLNDYGLTYDESVDKKGDFGPYRQSERLEIYRQYTQRLIEKGHAYYCICSQKRLDDLRKEQQAKKKVPRYDKHCLKHLTRDMKHITQGKYVVRLNVPPDKEISFHDLVRGKITFNTNDIDDQILIKSDGFPTYHLAVVIDDHLMKISHVIRGEEWISSTPKHILLYQAFGWQSPIYVHQPLLRNSDRSKLSKRKSPVWASWYLEQGFFPEAVLNFLALMGWSHPEGKEIFSLDEFVRVLDLKRFQAVGPVFDINKLKWINGEYIRAMSAKNFQFSMSNFYIEEYSMDLIKKTIPLIQERIHTLAEYDDYCRFFIERPKKYETNMAKYRQLLSAISDRLTEMPENEWKADIIGQNMQELAKKENMQLAKFFMILRIALTGKKITPPLNESMEILGKDECIKRLKLVLF